MLPSSRSREGTSHRMVWSVSGKKSKEGEEMKVTFLFLLFSQTPSGFQQMKTGSRELTAALGRLCWLDWLIMGTTQRG